MPQELQVLRCYSCNFFQVHIVKKSKKWDCKMCGEKQSMKKVYGRGSGQDCRMHVQKLNKLAVLQQENQIALYGNSQQSEYTTRNEAQNIHGTMSFDFQNCRRLNPSASISSKWSVFLDKPKNDDNEEENHQFSEAPKHKFEDCQFPGSFQNAGSSLQSSGASMEDEAAACNLQLVASRNENNYETQDGYLAKALKLSVNYFNDTAYPDNIYKNIQESSTLKLPENKWFKCEDKVANIQRDSNMKQLSHHNHNPKREKELFCDESFKSFSKCDMYLENTTCDVGSSNIFEVSSQLMKNNKISQSVPQRNDSVEYSQDVTFPSAILKTTEKQVLSRKGVTINGNISAEGINTLSSSNAFDRDYDEDELNCILDI